MTALVDIVFIVLFATLVSSVGLVRAPDETAVPETVSEETAPAETVSEQTVPAVPAAPASHDALRERALDQLSRALSGRRGHFVRVSQSGQVTAIETESAGGIERRSMAVPLVARVADPDVVLEYLGDRSADLRLCALVARELGLDNLEDELVIVVPEAALAELPLALARGLLSDVDRCRAQQGIAVLVGPDEG